jgi:hypothetical protein
MTEGSRRARIETRHANPETARLIAAAVRPDNTPEMTTEAEDDRIVTEIRRDTTGGLRTTVDDYVVNLQTGAQLATRDREPSTAETDNP